MRYSPYATEDYGLQHSNGTLLPFTAVDSEAEWNLLWLSIPQLDQYLDIQSGAFDAYRRLLARFPFLQAVKVRTLLKDHPVLDELLETATPDDAARFIRGCKGAAEEYIQAVPTWLETIEVRASMAQSLVDVKDAADLCKSVIAVDFRAGRRL